MKRILLFSLPILIIISVIFAIFGFYQARSIQERLIDEVKSKAKAVTESMELSAGQILATRDLRKAQRLIEKFETRERLQGCVLYDREGKLFVITKRFSEWKGQQKPYLVKVLSEKKPHGELTKFGDYSVYSYVHPVLDDDEQILGLVEVIYDTSYVFTRLIGLWKRISITLIVLMISILLISLLTLRQLFVVPVQRLTEWFVHFQRGNTNLKPPIRDAGELGKLAEEVEQVALSLRVARQSMIEDAQGRMEKGELWTEKRLRDLVVAKLGENSLFVVSNREPYLHVFDAERSETKMMFPASGVVTAIDPIMRACGGTWVAHGSGNADKRFVNSRNKLGVPPGDERYILKRVWLTKEEEEGYYFGFSNEGLWPLCHVTHTRPIFRETDWQMYRKVNEKFADSLLEELPVDNPFIFIQDYHFTLLPQMIKKKRPDATIALFWHIPWPNPEVFAICPYQEEILEGMLGCDLIGFHVQNHCNNFLDTANRLMESRVDIEKFSVVRSGRETLVRAYPISVDLSVFGTPTESVLKQKEKIREELKLNGRIVAVSVERIDYTKGIVERILAIDRFLEKYPEYKKRFVFIQIAAPSRTHIKRYHDLIGEIDELIERKNWKYSDGDWSPILYFKRQFTHEEISPYYQLADLCIVSSLHDGMNLVAKEFIAAKHDLSGILLLSRFTGAARELTDAVPINPYAIEEFADSIKEAIELPAEEKRLRMMRMRETVGKNNVYFWAANIITDLTELKNTQSLRKEQG
ncbi:MAG: trehalose-6-phosphate synthase [Deltaproteobacteria bacterium]|nr:trehalose-6-phosphate synthase [Deltaproteobacteria bacterium]